MSLSWVRMRISRGECSGSRHRAYWFTVVRAAFLACIVTFNVIHDVSPSPAQSNNANHASPQQQVDPDAIVVAPATAMHIALDRLREEGRAFHRSGRLDLTTPDFVGRFGYPLEDALVIDELLTVQSSTDAIMDGYVRWQLLSTKPEMDSAGYDLKMHRFRRFVETLPGIPPHPALDPDLHEKYERLAELAGRNSEVREKLAAKWEALLLRVHQHEVLTFPSIEFRDAMYKVLPAKGPYRPVFLIYDLRDRIQAGMSTRTIKTRITKELKERRLDESLTPDLRWELIKQIEAMDKDNDAGSTKVIRDITFFAKSPADVHYSTMSVRPSDAEKWTAYLNRIEP